MFESGFSLAGTVTRNGQPVDGAGVSASLGGGGSFNSARTSASGAYRIEGLTAGTYTVTASLAGGMGGAPRTQSITIDGDATLDLVIPFARIGGMVLDGATHQPLADVVVQATTRPATRGPRTASTDSNGRFSLEDLEASPYTLVSRKTGYQLDTREITPAESGGDDLVVELARGAGILLEVRGASSAFPASCRRGPAARAPFGQRPLDATGAADSVPPRAAIACRYASGMPLILTPLVPSVFAAAVGGGMRGSTRVRQSGNDAPRSDHRRPALSFASSAGRTAHPDRRLKTRRGPYVSGRRAEPRPFSAGRTITTRPASGARLGFAPSTALITGRQGLPAPCHGT